MDSLPLKHHNSFQNENNKKATHNFAARPLIFKLPQEVLKFKTPAFLYLITYLFNLLAYLFL